jgi:hypothetical protein
MATTTNYGWTTPDDTALVKDGAAALRSLGTSVDTTTKNLNPSTTLGDIEYRSSTANTNTRLGIGSTGNVLTVAGGVPTWAAPAGGGKVLQVVQGTYATQTSITSTTFTDSGLTATITPSSASSKVLVLVSMPCWITPLSGTPSQVAGWLKILRGATDISTITTSNTFGIGSSNGNMQFALIAGMNYLDSPATTSATTYKLQGAQQQSSDLLQFCRGSSQSTIVLMEIGA